MGTDLDTDVRLLVDTAASSQMDTAGYCRGYIGILPELSVRISRWILETAPLRFIPESLPGGCGHNDPFSATSYIRFN